MVDFNTSLQLSDCIQRLQKLAAQVHFYSPVGRSTAHIKIDSFEFDTIDSKTAFRLYAKCSSHREEFPNFVFFKLEGELQPIGDNTEVHYRLQLHKPSSIILKILIFWGIVIAFALIGVITRDLTSNSINDLFLIVVVVFLAGCGYIWTLYRSYKLGMVSIPSVVYQVIRQEPIQLDKNQTPPDWIMDLSEPN